jgi:hypothetical protein
VRLSPRNQDILIFTVLALWAIIMFIVMIRALPARAYVDPFGVEANSDLHATTYEETADWAFLVDKYFDDGDFDTAMSILACESGGNPTAQNPRSTARGGWQFLKSTWGWATTGSGFDVDPYPAGPDDPVQSTMMAAWLQNTYGWTQWECYGVRQRVWVQPVTVDLVSDGQQARD